MKIYIILDGQAERMIRTVAFSVQLATKICESFPHLDLFVEVYETLDNEKLKDF